MKIYAQPSSLFYVLDSKSWLGLGFLLEKDCMLQYFMNNKNKLIYNQILWRAVDEKHSSFMQIIIKSLTNKGDIIMDWQTDTSISFSLFFHLSFNFQLLRHLDFVTQFPISLSLTSTSFLFARYIYCNMPWEWPPHCGSREGFEHLQSPPQVFGRSDALSFNSMLCTFGFE